MTPPVLTFFNNKGGVGKTSLIYHLAWMFSSLGKRVVVVDLDAQANLTAAFLEDDEIEALWAERVQGATIYQCVRPLTGVEDIASPVLRKVSNRLYLLPGDVSLSSFEDALSNEWPKSLEEKNLYRPMRILTAFWQVMQMAADETEADLILVDVGPNLGAINRSVLIATDYVAIPVGADLFSLQGMKNLGPTLRSWRTSWEKRFKNWQESSEQGDHPDFKLPYGLMKPIGYLCQQHGVRLDRPIKAYDKWVKQYPKVYRESVLNQKPSGASLPQDDDHCLATIKHYRSLIPMGQEHRKPIFNLTSADGAIGAHSNAVRDAKQDFKQLALKIAERIELAG